LVKDFESVNPLKISIKISNKILCFDGIIHRSDQVLILELEPRSKKKVDDFSFYHLVKSIDKIQNASSLHDMCQIVVKEVQNLQVLTESWSINLTANELAQSSPRRS